MDTFIKMKLIEYINQNEEEKEWEYWDGIAGKFVTMRTKVISVADLIDFINKLNRKEK